MPLPATKREAVLSVLREYKGNIFERSAAKFARDVKKQTGQDVSEAYVSGIRKENPAANKSPKAVQAPAANGPLKMEEKTFLEAIKTVGEIRLLAERMGGSQNLISTVQQMSEAGIVK